MAFKDSTFRSVRAAAVAIGLVVSATPAYAQVDPLLFLKSTQPNVLLVVDVANRMHRDAPTDPTNAQTTSNYYDPFIYSRTGAAWETDLGVTPINTMLNYRRKYRGLTYTSNGTGDRFSANTICVTGDSGSTCTDTVQMPFGYFGAPTRMSVVRAALYQAVVENQSVARFGLIQMRQNSAQVASLGNSGPVAVADPTQLMPTDINSTTGRWAISRPLVNTTDGSATSSGLLVKADASGANSSILGILAKDTRTSGGLLPAGADDANTQDTPVNNMLVDAKAEATRLINLDTACRNTVVVLVVGGGEGNTGSATNSTLGTTASGFISVALGRRVPVYVVAIAPPASDVPALQAIATNSGGQYFEVDKAQIDAALTSPIQTAASTYPCTAWPCAPSGTVVVPDVVKAIDTAVQHAFANPSDVNTAPTSALPIGPLSEFQTTSPIVGTANLNGGHDINGSALSPDAATVLDRAGNVIPQRSNVLLTSAFSMPGFDMQMRAFRIYKPVQDSTQPSGWRFVSDGTRLWIASAPPAASRNLYTVLPSGTMIAFNDANATQLAQYMNLNVTDATSVIDLVRSLPLGAPLDSTPALMNPPSLDPPPDDTYPAFAQANANRRSVVWVGTNRGILECIDARLGQEVWGFIPFNLLPKLRTLRDGQPVGAFDFFVDGSPKIADVKLADNSWHTYMFIGEGPGGSYYTTLDVTFPNMASSVSPTDDNIADVLNYFSNPTIVPVKWTYPLNTDFDPTVKSVQPYSWALNSSAPTLMPFGDIAAGAPTLEKTVGQTWSDPAIGQVVSSNSPYVMLTGSGFMPYSRQRQTNRSGVVAGTTFYMLNVNDGTVLASKDVGSDGVAETIDNCVAVNNCTQFKNALQSDPVATGPSDSRFITKAYVGDLDGKMWRFDIGLSSNTPIFTANPTVLYTDPNTQPFFSSMATVNVGGTQQYLFAGTGSDLLPANGVAQQYKLLGVLDNGSSGTKTFEFDLTKVDGTAGDEKVTAFPAVAGDIVFFTTTTFNPATPCTPPTASLYALTFIGGPAYDTNNDGQFNSRDSILVKSVAGQRATAPFIVDQHLVFTTGSQLQIFGDPQNYNNGIGQAGVRLLSWREVR